MQWSACLYFQSIAVQAKSLACITREYQSMQNIEYEKTIDSGIPMPGPSANRRRIRKYPFADMKVGDSFLLDNRVHRNSALSAAYKWREAGNGVGWKFATRQVSGGFRLWRIE
jgi:hypothetical protein